MQPTPSMICVKCGEKQELGLMIDGAEPLHRTPERVQEWVRGTPSRTWFTLRFKAPKEDRLQVVALRCTRCGFLEMYAPDPKDYEGQDQA